MLSVHIKKGVDLYSGIVNGVVVILVVLTVESRDVWLHEEVHVLIW